MGSEGNLHPITETYRALARLPPAIRIVAGLALVAAGASLALLLWGRGVTWGFTLFGAAAGVILTASGLFEIKRRRHRASVLSRKEDLVRGMIDVKRRGKNPLQWLREEGIRDAEVRAELLRAMNQRLKPERAS